MKINVTSAFIAGTIGGGVMSLILYAARATGLTRMNLEMMEGSMFTRDVSVLTWMIGVFVHLVLSGLIGIVYGCVLELWGAATWWRGMVIALGHTLLAGGFMWLIPAIHPAVPELLPDPGFLAGNFGAATVAAVVVAHLVYGAVVGWIYRKRGDIRSHLHGVAAPPTDQRP